MKKIFVVLLIALWLAAMFFIGYAVSPNDKPCNCENQTEYKIVYVEKECTQDVVYVVEQCNELTKEDYREYHDSVLEERKELIGEPVEIRPANYVSHCDRAGVVC